MARTEIRTDDLDGSTIDVREVRLALDGREYALDLSAANRDALREALDVYLLAAHSPKPKADRPKVDRSDPKSARVRTWARDNGWAVGDRGRIPAGVIAAYEIAHAA